MQKTTLKLNVKIYKFNKYNDMYIQLNKYKQKKRIWSYNWLKNRNQEFAGAYNLLIEEFAKEQPSEFINFVRIKEIQFNQLADMLKPDIMCRDTNYLKCIPVKMRLAITMRFLATGYFNITFNY